MKKIVYYGATEYFDETQAYFDFNKMQIVAVIDSDSTNHGKLIHGIKVKPLSEIASMEYDWILLCSAGYQEAIQSLLDIGVDDKKIMISPQFSQAYDNDARRKETLELNIPLKRYANFINECFKPNMVRGYRHFSVTDIICERERPLMIKNFIEAAGQNYVGYVRLATLQLLSEQVVKRDIKGDIAELGVYRGDFAASMNELLPNRNFHLFDTFEGFDNKDLVFEEKTGFLARRAKAGVFSDTSVDYVLSRMTTPDSCVVHKGYFPDTTSNLPDSIIYSLVSIDADIYKPIREGLSYFYDHLACGGYIIVHDYNQIGKWSGATKAVDEFCHERNISFIPIPDECGSVIFCKPCSHV